MKKVMIFGIFDGIHKGHRDFFRAAKEYGDYLIAVVAQDHIVEHIYGKLPKVNFADRFAHLEREDEVNQIVIGEPTASVVNLVKRYEPNAMIFSTTQEILQEDFERHKQEIPFPVAAYTIEGHETMSHPL